MRGGALEAPAAEYIGAGSPGAVPCSVRPRLRLLSSLALRPLLRACASPRPGPARTISADSPLYNGIARTRRLQRASSCVPFMGMMGCRMLSRGRLLAWVLLCAAGVTVPAGGSEGGPDDARAWGAPPPHTSDVSDAIPPRRGSSRSVLIPPPNACCHPRPARACRSADTLTPAVPWADTPLWRLAEGGGAARLEGAAWTRVARAAAERAEDARCRPLVRGALEPPPVAHAGGSGSQAHAVSVFVLLPARHTARRRHGARRVRAGGA